MRPAQPRKPKRSTSDKTSANNFSTKRIEALSKLSEAAERSLSLRWFEGQGERKRVEIIAAQTELIKIHLTKAEENPPEFFYSMLLLAIKNARRTEDNLSMKKSVSIAEGNEIALDRADGFKREKKMRGAEKATKIRVQFYGMICVLKEQKGFSWAEIASYLYRYHGNFSVTPAYIQQMYCKIKKEAENAELPQ